MKVELPPGPLLRRSYRADLISLPSEAIIVYAQGRSLLFYNCEDHTCERRISCKTAICAVEVDLSGEYIAVGDDEGVVEVLDLKSDGYPTLLSLRFAEEISSLSFNEAGELLIAHKTLSAYNFSTEQQRELACPASYITQLKTSGAVACATSFGGDVYFYTGEPLAFSCALELHQEEQECTFLGGYWYVFGFSGMVRLYSSQGELLLTTKVAEMTVYAASPFSCDDISYIACATSDAELIILSAFDGNNVPILARHQLANQVYANNIVSLAYNEALQELFAFTLGGKLIALPIRVALESNQNLDQFVVCVTETETSSVFSTEAQLFRFGYKSLVVSGRDLTNARLLNEEAFDKVLPNKVLYAVEFRNCVRGFTTTESFWVESDRYYSEQLKFTVFTACGCVNSEDFNFDAVLFSKNKVYGYIFESRKEVEIYSLSPNYREITAACQHGSEFVLSVTPKRSDEKSQIMICAEDFAFSRGCDIFVETTFLRSIGGIILAASADTQFVAFINEDFEKNEPWPKFTRMDKGSKIQGRVEGATMLSESPLELLVYGQNGLCKWEFEESGELINHFLTNSPVVGVVDEVAYCADGSARHLAFQE